MICRTCSCIYLLVRLFSCRLILQKLTTLETKTSTSGSSRRENCGASDEAKATLKGEEITTDQCEIA